MRASLVWRMVRFLSSGRAQAFERGLVAAVAAGEKARAPGDGGHGNARDLVNLAVGHAILEILHHRPAVDERFELGRRAEVGQKLLAFGLGLHAQHRPIAASLRPPCALSTPGAASWIA